MALGQMSKSSGNRAAALGSGANAAGDHSLALGGRLMLKVSILWQ